jgi:predicted TIM-barrel fold metal-dependent hydrolase
VAAIQAETGIAVESIADLRQAIEAIFARHAPTAIAVKTQHAYNRTLHWQERDDSQAEHVLQRILAGQQVEADELLCIGDWALARGVEQAIAHHLPFKIHTGYYAGYGRMPVERIQSGLLTPLLRRFPDARFVLMHLAYPYSGELIALAKHYPNVYIDMCWSWSIDPYSSCDALRRAIHAVPDNKVFAFGGDTFLPAAAVAYAAQARTWLTRALQAEVDQGLLSERDAIGLATRLMRDNQLACFDVGGRRQTIAAQLVS